MNTAENLRRWAMDIRRHPAPISEAIPIVQTAADELDALAARLAEATDLIDEAYNHGDTESWGERAAKFLRAANSADAAHLVNILDKSPSTCPHCKRKEGELHRIDCPHCEPEGGATVSASADPAGPSPGGWCKRDICNATRICHWPQSCKRTASTADEVQR